MFPILINHKLFIARIYCLWLYSLMTNYGILMAEAGVLTFVWENLNHRNRFWQITNNQQQNVFICLFQSLWLIFAYRTVERCTLLKTICPLKTKKILEWRSSLLNGNNYHFSPFRFVVFIFRRNISKLILKHEALELSFRFGNPLQVVSSDHWETN